MKQNLDVLKTEIREYLESRRLVIFYGYSRALDALPIVFWDTHGHPDYKEFVSAAEAAGAKLIVLHAREFTSEYVEGAIDRLEECDLSVEERRPLERRLREMRAYDGFTCAIELSFDFEGRAYIFDLRTDWYEEFNDMLDDIEGAMPDADEDEDEGPIGGYFSKN
ncbi:MAG TPA: hypothetical protein VFA28_17080 [Bryobacteraceae bacterium]|jgi:hypothetical protein|nr:hypothetical protein [Bryobacteraceae bacterium]